MDECIISNEHLSYGGLAMPIRCMESGEDPEKIEEEMGNILSEEDLFTAASIHTKQRKSHLSETRLFIIYKNE